MIATLPDPKTRLADPFITLDDRPFDTFHDRWAVAQVKSFPAGSEKQLARDLAARGIGYFLPLERPERRGGRLRVLFDDYLFFSGSDGDRYEVVRTGRVIRVIDVLSCARQAKLREQLQFIYVGLVAGRTFTPPPVTTGCRVRITYGPFEGYEGTVAEMLNTERCSVVIEYFGRATLIDVSTDDVERI